MDDEQRDRELERAFALKSEVVGALEPALDPSLTLGEKSVAVMFRIFGFLPINVWLSETDPAPRRQAELQTMVPRLAAAMLNVIDHLRESSGLGLLATPAAVADELDKARVDRIDYELRGLRMTREKLGPEEVPDSLFEEARAREVRMSLRDEQWQEDPRPLSRWLAYFGVFLGGGALDVLAGQRAPGAKNDRALYRPLELTLDLMNWLGPSSGASSEPA